VVKRRNRDRLGVFTTADRPWGFPDQTAGAGAPPPAGAGRGGPCGRRQGAPGGRPRAGERRPPAGFGLGGLHHEQKLFSDERPLHSQTVDDGFAECRSTPDTAPPSASPSNV